ALACRQQHARLFDEGTYQPLEVDGAKKDHVCSFSRVLDGETVLIVVPRLLVGLMGGAERPPVGEAVWHDTSLLLPVEEKGRRYRNAFTAETVTVGERDGKPGLGLAEILGSFPVALLTRLAGGETSRQQAGRSHPEGRSGPKFLLLENRKPDPARGAPGRPRRGAPSRLLLGGLRPGL